MNLNSLSTLDIIIVLLLSLVPSFILLSLILYSDRKSKEPMHLILICLFSGIFTIGLSLILGNIIIPSLDLISTKFINNIEFNILKIIILALIEEYCKLMVLYFFISHNKSFDDIYDGFVYSTIIALSFAVFETLIYVFGESTFSQMSTLAILRDFTTIPLHLVCGIIMGYYIGVEKFSKSKKFKLRKLIKSLLFPTLVHTLYNTFFSIVIILFKDSNFFILIFFIFIFMIYLIGIIYIKRVKKMNVIFMGNGDYPKNYNVLMTKTEYIDKINDTDLYNC